MPCRQSGISKSRFHSCLPPALWLALFPDAIRWALLVKSCSVKLSLCWGVRYLGDCESDRTNEVVKLGVAWWLKIQIGNWIEMGLRPTGEKTWLSGIVLNFRLLLTFTYNTESPHKRIELYIKSIQDIVCPVFFLQYSVFCICFGFHLSVKVSVLKNG